MIDFTSLRFTPSCRHLSPLRAPLCVWVCRCLLCSALKTPSPRCTYAPNIDPALSSTSIPTRVLCSVEHHFQDISSPQGHSIPKQSYLDLCMYHDGRNTHAAKLSNHELPTAPRVARQHLWPSLRSRRGTVHTNLPARHTLPIIQHPSWNGAHLPLPHSDLAYEQDYRG